MADREPVPITLTVDSNCNAGSLADSEARIFYVTPGWHDIGLADFETPGGHMVRSYDPEKNRHRHREVQGRPWALPLTPMP